MEEKYFEDLGVKSGVFYRTTQVSDLNSLFSTLVNVNIELNMIFEKDKVTLSQASPLGVFFTFGQFRLDLGNTTYIFKGQKPFYVTFTIDCLLNVLGLLNSDYCFSIIYDDDQRSIWFIIRDPEGNNEVVVEMNTIETKIDELLPTEEYIATFMLRVDDLQRTIKVFNKFGKNEEIVQLQCIPDIRKNEATLSFHFKNILSSVSSKKRLTLKNLECEQQKEKKDMLEVIENSNVLEAAEKLIDLNRHNQRSSLGTFDHFPGKFKTSFMIRSLNSATKMSGGQYVKLKVFDTKADPRANENIPPPINLEYELQGLGFIKFILFPQKCPEDFEDFTNTNDSKKKRKLDNNLGSVY